uniref:Uncharacterized protein n=1 Tax=Anguilla anguilla TaxID=7936 RepID=A0A0E9WU91_ANGAN
MKPSGTCGTSGSEFLLMSHIAYLGTISFFLLFSPRHCLDLTISTASHKTTMRKWRTITSPVIYLIKHRATQTHNSLH